jgi:hypothetical protein
MDVDRTDATQDPLEVEEILEKETSVVEDILEKKTSDETAAER